MIKLMSQFSYVNQKFVYKRMLIASIIIINKHIVDDTMVLEFNYKRCLFFILALIGLQLLYFAYRDRMLELSHGFIIDIQDGASKDSTMSNFMKQIDLSTYYYTSGCVLMSPFMSRERFWYFLIVPIFANWAKDNFKMLY